ncbi:MAG TPA: hypothetical protein VFJ13_05340, partial [Paracoccaceae bacterium]|nr:hypothetical protein [Paracoccaceae bacterium]
EPVQPEPDYAEPDYAEEPRHAPEPARPAARRPAPEQYAPSQQRAPAPAPQPAAIARQPAPEPQARQSAQPARRDESRYATSPSPSDIRARAEEVRQRAMAARSRRDEDRRPPVPHDDEPALFDIDEGSLDARAEPRHPAPEPAPVRRAPVDDVFAQRPQPDPEARQNARTGLFTINKLIHRVAGSGTPDQRADRRQPPDLDDDGGEIPAFLRRQAN